MAGATKGQNGQFTYDFGIKIAQGTLGTLTKLTGVTLTLAGAIYALKSTATEYVSTLRENTLLFGGVLSTMEAMQQAQTRLLKGQSYFGVDDQLQGMRRLQSVGIEVGENLEFMNKAAHAMGKSFSDFTQMVVSATNGNFSSMIDAGLMTQRSAKIFEKYRGNYIAMRGAIMDFMKSHKGLLNAIENDFSTIEDQTKRMRGFVTMFWQSVLGTPNQKGGLYWTIVQTKKSLNDALAKNMAAIKHYGEGVGVVLSYMYKQLGHFVTWVARKAKKAAEYLFGTADNFAERMRSFVVWMEFWKLRVLKFFDEYGDAIKSIVKWLIIMKATSKALTISPAAIHSVRLYKRELLGLFALRRRYVMAQGPYIAGWKKHLQSLAVFMPKPYRKVWVWFGKFFAGLSFNVKLFWNKTSRFFTTGARFIGNLFKNFRVIVNSLAGPAKKVLSFFPKLWKWLKIGMKFTGKVGLRAVPYLGLILLAVDLFTILYKYLKGYKEMVHGFCATWFEFGKLIANVFIAAWVTIRNWGKQVWTFMQRAWTAIKDWCSNLWSNLKNLGVKIWSGIKKVGTAVWDFIKRIGSKIKNLISPFWNWIMNKLEPVFQWFRDTLYNFQLWWEDDFYPAFSKGIKAIGGFLNTWIVEPIKKVWTWLKDAWKWFSGLYNRLANWIGKGNTSLSEYITEASGGKYTGFKGGNYTAGSYFGDGTTTYGGTKKDKPAVGSGVALQGANVTPTATTEPPKKKEKNPIVDEKYPMNDLTSSGSSIGTAMQFSSGAIVVNVYGGDTLNEEKIAKEVKKAIKEIQREGDMRGGNA